MKVRSELIIARALAGAGDLHRRIAEGKAEPISDRERAIVADMIADFERTYGKPAGDRRPS